MRTIQISTDITATFTNKTAKLYDAAIAASVNLKRWMRNESYEDFDDFDNLCNQCHEAWYNFVTGGRSK